MSRRHEEDRLLDSVIALDALFNDDIHAKNIVGLIASRFGRIWPSEAAFDARTAVKAVRAAYRARNKIAHGDSVDEQELEAAAKNALAVARIVTVELLERRAASGNYTIDWERESELAKARAAQRRSDAASLAR